jgi:hypothetical protein
MDYARIASRIAAEPAIIGRFVEMVKSVFQEAKYKDELESVKRAAQTAYTSCDVGDPLDHIQVIPDEHIDAFERICKQILGYIRYHERTLVDSGVLGKSVEDVSAYLDKEMGETYFTGMRKAWKEESTKLDRLKKTQNLSDSGNEAYNEKIAMLKMDFLRSIITKVTDMMSPASRLIQGMPALKPDSLVDQAKGIWQGLKGAILPSSS